MRYYDHKKVFSFRKSSLLSAGLLKSNDLENSFDEE